MDRGKVADACCNLFGDAVQLQGQLGDDAESALGPDHQPREIVTRRRFARAPARRQQFAVRHYAL